MSGQIEIRVTSARRLAAIAGRRRTTRRRRLGISLLEIMISIGIVGIGLIGVAALIPLAHHKAAQGVQEDRKSLFGKRAFREFRVRGMDRPGTISSPAWFCNSLDGGQQQLFNPQTGRPIRRAYCLDPLLVAARDQQNRPGLFLFPAPPAGKNFGPWNILRLTLLPSPSGLSSQGFMTLTQAQEVFTLRDDLVLPQSTDQNVPSQLGYLSLKVGGRNVSTKMLSGGTYSWLATLVPDPLDLTDAYALSIVVFQGRNLLAPIPEEITAQVVPELSMVSGLVKDVTLKQLTPPITPPDGDFGLKQLRAGDWILLGQELPASPPLRPLPVQLLKWYRVVTVDQTDDTDEMVRHATLDGPDWNVDLVRGPPLFAVYLRGVVAVYEKTVRLHESTLYAQDMPPT